MEVVVDIFSGVLLDEIVVIVDVLIGDFFDIIIIEEEVELKFGKKKKEKLKLFSKFKIDFEVD